MDCERSLFLLCLLKVLTNAAEIVVWSRTGCLVKTELIKTYCQVCRKKLLSKAIRYLLVAESGSSRSARFHSQP